MPPTSPVQFAVLTTCFQRWEPLARVLPSWQLLHGVRRIVIGHRVDDPPPPLGAGGNPGVELIGVEDSVFHIARLRNCVAGVVRADESITHLLFIDGDIMVLDPMVFAAAFAVAGGVAPVDVAVDSPFAVRLRVEDCQRPGDPEHMGDRGKRGTHAVRKELFFSINGYDQRLIGWAGEDINIYRRYALAGARIGWYDRRRIAHLAHGDAARERANPPGESAMQSLMRNRRITFESSDLLGESWRDSFGYPRWTHRRSGADGEFHAVVDGGAAGAAP